MHYGSFMVSFLEMGKCQFTSIGVLVELTTIETLLQYWIETHITTSTEPDAVTLMLSVI